MKPQINDTYYDTEYKHTVTLIDIEDEYYYVGINNQIITSGDIHLFSGQFLDNGEFEPPRFIYIDIRFNR
jgi:hypothetical protein